MELDVVGLLETDLHVSALHVENSDMLIGSIHDSALFSAIVTCK